MTDSEEEERRRRNAEDAGKAAASLRFALRSESSRLDTSDCGYLIEVANDLASGKRPGVLDRLWTMRLLYRFYLG